jgi:RNA polymerase sigma factor (TIGR02999 family)
VDTSNPTTRLTLAVARGEPGAVDALMPHVYDELRAIAARLMQRERAEHTLRPTELIHEAYLRLVDVDGVEGTDEELRAHFNRVAVRAMRFVLVDHARKKHAQKRGGGGRRVPLDEEGVAAPVDVLEVLQVHDGLERLAAIDEALASVVELRYFGGLTIEEAADSLGVSRRTAVRRFRLARAWLVREFGEGGPHGPE